MARIYIADIRDEMWHFGWELIEEKYVNLKTPMKMKCPVGHEVFVPYEKWRKKHSCPVCEEKIKREAEQQKREEKEKKQREKEEALAEKNKKPYYTGDVPKKEKGITRILALDDATTTTGWSLFDNTTLIKFGKISMGKIDPIARMVGLRQWLLSIIELYQPDIVGIEDIQLQTYVGKTGKTEGQVKMFKTLAQLQGILLATLYEIKVDYLIVHSAKWRAALSFHSKTRSDLKREAQLMVESWYKVKPTQDEADAICMGKYIALKHTKNNLMMNWEDIT